MSAKGCGLLRSKSGVAFVRIMITEGRGSSILTPFANQQAYSLHPYLLHRRDLSNERADEMHPARLEEVATAVAAEIGAEVHV